MSLTWYSAGTEEPLDEQADLMAGYWAVIGPTAEGRFSWVIVAPDSEDAAEGNADDAGTAKAAVEQWLGGALLAKHVMSEAPHWTDETDAQAAELFKTLPTAEIRRRQDLAAQQIRLAWEQKNERALADLRRMQDALTGEMFRRTDHEFK